MSGNGGWGVIKPPYRKPKARRMNAPPGFEAEFQELCRLSELDPDDPVVQSRRLRLNKSMSSRLPPDQHPEFRATLLSDRGNVYQVRRSRDRAVDLRRAISCYRRALAGLGRDGQPALYARTVANIGSAYADLPVGNRARNLRRAIAAYKDVLTVVIPESSLSGCAMAWHNLGTFYAGLPSGDRVRNLRRSVGCYRRALRSCTPETDPSTYAKTMSDLGNAYADMPVYHPAERARRAVVCYRKAMAVATPETDPLLHATVRGNLGTVYAQRPDGDRARNLRRAIAAFKDALGVLTPRVDPFEYARLNANLGGAYASLPLDDRTAALHRAIESYQEALGVYTPETAPFDYARTLIGLGNAAGELPPRERSGHPDFVNDCCNEALSYLDPQVSPRDYAVAKRSLGCAYAERQVGERADNLRNAIACFEEALSHSTPESAPDSFAATQTDLGNAYVQLATADRVNNRRHIQSAVACFEQALRFRTSETTPFDYAATQLNLGNAYANLAGEDRVESRRRAAACYEEVLRIADAETSPELCRKAGLSLGHVHFEEGREHDALAAYAKAAAALEVTYLASDTTSSRQAALSEALNLYWITAFSLARLGRLGEAVERLEASRARGLAEALGRDRVALDGVRPEDHEAFRAAGRRVRTLEVESRWAGPRIGAGPTTPRPFTAIADELRAARQRFDEVAARIRGYLPGFLPRALDLAAIAAAGEPGRPLVYLVSTPRGSLAVIVPPGATELAPRHAVWFEGLTSLNLLHEMFQGDPARGDARGFVVGQVFGAKAELSEGLERLWPTLRDRLTGPLDTRLQELGFTRAVLVPTGVFALLPLPAAGTAAITYSLTPSARVHLAARRSARERDSRAPELLAVGNPLPGPKPLTFARAEVESIASRFPAESRRVLLEDQATRAAVIRALPGATHLHLACHALYDVAEPLDSRLLLAGDDALTLRDILDGGLDLAATRLVVLSACRTGLVDMTSVPDEVLGLPAGFLRSGVPGVVSTLWPVDDAATALLMRRFYQEQDENGLDPASALHRAQRWVREATSRELNPPDVEEDEDKDLDESARDLVPATPPDRARRGATPFSHPYYWAAFTFTGVG
jgi:CHAT domain-containing protein/tetratricopeptide (TPR) repeat protein